MSSKRRMKRPPSALAASKAVRAEKAWPLCSRPVGEGAKRVVKAAVVIAAHHNPTALRHAGVAESVHWIERLSRATIRARPLQRTEGGVSSVQPLTHRSASTRRPLVGGHAMQVLMRPPSGWPALVLNADYRPLSYYPLSLWPWQEVIKAVFLDRVDVIATYY